MVLYLQACTDTPDLIIDFIEVKLKDGRTVSLNWDESYIDRDSDGFSAKYKGIYFNEEYANGRIDELKDMKIVEVELYTETDENPKLSIDKMTFVDGDYDELIFMYPYQNCLSNIDKDVVKGYKSFMLKWMKDNDYDLKNFSDIEEKDAICSFFDIAYDMKFEFTEKYNPFDEKERLKPEYFSSLDLWYDEMVGDIIIPTLKVLKKEKLYEVQNGH